MESNLYPSDLRATVLDPTIHAAISHTFAL